MKKLILMSSLVVFATLFGCEKVDNRMISESENNNLSEIISNKQSEDVVISEKGYLIFKNKECYDDIIKQIDKMTDEEFSKWEKLLGFQSSLTFLLNVQEKIEQASTIEEYNLIKQQFADKLVFESDGSVRLPFYATAWDRVLNIDGIMKIGKMMYKFEKDREYLITNGNDNDLNNLSMIVSDTSKVRVFFPRIEINHTNLKSIEWGELDYLEYATGNLYGHDRIQAYLQLISYNYTGYGYNTGVYYTEGGFDLKIRIDAQRKGIFGWYSNKTTYYLRDIFLNMRHCLLGWQCPWADNITMCCPDPRVIINGNLADYTSSHTNQGLRYSFYEYYDCLTGNHAHIEPDIFNFSCTFWTSDLGYNDRQSFNYSNQ